MSSSETMGPPGLPVKIAGILITLFQLLYWYVEALYRQFVPPPMKSIDGETILVTGAVGGIGKEICRHIIRSGENIKLILWDLNETSLEKFAEELRSAGKGKVIKVFHFSVDISSKENIVKACEKVKDRIGPVSIIFNNAGIAIFGNFLQLKDEEISKTIDVNLLSQFWIIRQFIPEMILRDHGRIVNICSIGGLSPGHNSFPYFASKYAVTGYSDCLRMELDMHANYGIHVTTVYPWFVKTPLINTLTRNEDADLGLLSVFPDFLDPEEVGRKTVDGMRREYEHVYLPRTIPIIMTMEKLVPTKFLKAGRSAYLNHFKHTDATDQKRWMAPLSSAIENSRRSEADLRSSVAG